MKITKSQLKQIIKEEATRFQKIQTLKEEAQRIRRQLKEMEEPLEDMSEGGEFDGPEYFEEGFLDTVKGAANRLVGVGIPKEIESAISGAKDAQSLALNVSAALNKVGGGQQKSVEWFGDLQDKLAAKAKEFGRNALWVQKAVGPAINKNFSGKQGLGTKGGAGGAYANQ